MFLISLYYGAPLAQRASYLALHSRHRSLFGPDGTVNYDYIITNSINSLLIGALTIVEPIWPILQNVSKTMIIIITGAHNDIDQKA